MKRITILLLILISATFTFSQNDTIINDEKAKDRFVIGLIPSTAPNIYGIAIGPVGSEAICNRPYTKYSHGLNLQVPGQGFFQPFYIDKAGYYYAKNDIDTVLENDSFAVNSRDTLPKKAIHNGLLISPLGTFTDQVNGISFSLWMSRGDKINGLSCNFLSNYYKQINGITIGFVNHIAQMKGIQIGLVNKTKDLKGFQFGLWNKNLERALPIVNWNF